MPFFVFGEELGPALLHALILDALQFGDLDLALLQPLPELVEVDRRLFAQAMLLLKVAPLPRIALQQLIKFLQPGCPPVQLVGPLLVGHLALLDKLARHLFALGVALLQSLHPRFAACNGIVQSRLLALEGINSFLLLQNVLLHLHQPPCVLALRFLQIGDVDDPLVDPAFEGRNLILQRTEGSREAFVLRLAPFHVLYQAADRLELVPDLGNRPRLGLVLHQPQPVPLFL